MASTPGHNSPGLHFGTLKADDPGKLHFAWAYTRVKKSNVLDNMIIFLDNKCKICHPHNAIHEVSHNHKSQTWTIYVKPAWWRANIRHVVFLFFRLNNTKSSSCFVGSRPAMFASSSAAENTLGLLSHLPDYLWLFETIPMSCFSGVNSCELSDKGPQVSCAGPFEWPPDSALLCLSAVCASWWSLHLAGCIDDLGHDAE